MDLTIPADSPNRRLDCLALIDATKHRWMQGHDSIANRIGQEKRARSFDRTR